MREFNYDLLANRNWDNEILSLAAQIHEFKGRQELYLKQQPAVLEKLVEVAKIQSTEASKFIKYLLKVILSAYRDFEDRVDVFGEKLSAAELVRRAVGSKIGKFTKSEIMEMVPTISKTSVESSLNKLIQENVIERHGNGKATFYTRIE